MKTARSICRENNLKIEISPLATSDKTEYVEYRDVKIGYISERIQKKGAHFGYSFPDTLQKDGFPINEKMKWISHLQQRFGNFPREWLLKEESKNSYYFLVYDIAYLENLLLKEIERIDREKIHHP